MNEPTLEITWEPGIRKGNVVLTAKAGNNMISPPVEIRIVNAKARADYVKRLCKDRNGINKEEVREKLEQIASRIYDKSSVKPPSSSEVEYRSTDAGMEYLKPTREGPVPIKLTNFKCQIVSDIVRDDGLEMVHILEFFAELEGREFHFTVSASQFHSMNWVIENMGPKAIVFAGSTLKDHTRVAIQRLSKDLKARVIFVHTGWRQVEGHGWCYLHAGGAIGLKGPINDIEIDLSAELIRCALPGPPEGEDSLRAIRASLKLLDLGPEHVIFPLFAAIWRAVLGNTDFSLHLAGATGVFKTEVAAMFQSFFGASFDARHLPGSWSSTENALEELCFVAKDAVIVIDDFAPSGSSHDIQRYHKKADRVFRAQGNRSGRGRLRPNGTMKLSRPPRGMVLSTGEDIPVGQSLRSRLMVLELEEGDIGAEKLTECQEAARTGAYAETMAGFLMWAAKNYDDLRTRLETRIPELRKEAGQERQHRRTLSIVAELQAGFEVFLDYVKEKGVFTPSESEDLRNRCWAALGEAALAQRHHQQASEPTSMFFQLLRSAIASGEAYVADPGGEAPVDDEPKALGWMLHKVGAGESPREEWRPQGARVGWIDGQDLFLEPGAAYKAAQRMATDTDRIPVAKKTLIKRLCEKGHLLTRDETRGKNTTRKQLQGTRRSVLHLRASILISRAQQAHGSPEDITEEESNDNGPEKRAQKELEFSSGPQLGPTTSPSIRSNTVSGPDGPNGPEMEGHSPENTGSDASCPIPPDESEEEKEWTR